jgi:hypothetical protein
LREREIADRCNTLRSVEEAVPSGAKDLPEIRPLPIESRRDGLRVAQNVSPGRDLRDEPVPQESVS